MRDAMERTDGSWNDTGVTGQVQRLENFTRFPAQVRIRQPPDAQEQMDRGKMRAMKMMMAQRESTRSWTDHAEGPPKMCAG